MANPTAAPIRAPPPSSPPAQTISDFPLPLILTYPTATPPRLITQGAEGRLYQTSHIFSSVPCALKYRPSKPYRHPLLDARLTRHRILSEARILQKCRREGVAVPALYAVDEANGVLSMEWIPGQPVRVRVNEFLRRRKDVHGDVGDVKAEEGGALVGLMRRIGEAVGKLHRSGVVHGDLTTSNMMLRPWTTEEHTNGHKSVAEPGPDRDEELEGEIIIIDFGLASQGSADEDRAVDLYVLERAFGSTHPRAEGLFSVVLEAYGKTFKAAPVVLKKLEDVRMRGRKRSMLG